MPEGDTNPQARPEHEQLLTNASGDRDEGVILGVVDDPFTEDDRYARVPYNRLNLGGVFVSGDAGFGKSSLVTNILVQLAEDGHGFCFANTREDTAVEVLRRLPDDRLDDVVLVGDISCGEQIIHPFNLLEIPSEKEPGEVSESVVVPTLRSVSDHWGVEINRIARLVGVIAAINEKTVFELPEIADMESPELPADEPLAEMLINAPLEREKGMPFLRRLQELREHEAVRSLFDPDGASLQQAVADEKIIIGAFSGFDDLPRDVATAGLLSKLRSVLVGTPSVQRPDKVFPVVIDQLDRAEVPEECITSFSSRGRSNNCPLILTTQYVEQLSKNSRKHIENNLANQLAFRSSNEQSANSLVDPLGLDGRKELLLLDRFVAQSSIEAVDGTYQGKIETIPMIAPRRSEDEVLDRFNG